MALENFDHSVSREQASAPAPQGTTAGVMARNGEGPATSEGLAIGGRFADFATLGGLFLAVGLALVVAFDHPSAVFLLFVFMLGLAPPLSAAFVFWNSQSKAIGPEALAVILVAAKSLLLCLLVAIIAFALIGTLIGTTVTSTVSLACAVIVVLVLRWSAGPGEFSQGLDAWLIIALALAVFALSPFNPTQTVPIGLLEYAFGARHFALWLMVGIAWTAAGIWLRRHEGWAFPDKKRISEALAIMAAALVVLLLYDDSHFTDFSHYMPLIGPAVHAGRGGIPMVDVYSVYGLLPWLIYHAAFDLFMPTFGTAAVVVRVINLCYFAVILAMLVLVTRRRLSALWFFVPAIFVALTSHGNGPGVMWNMNALPMTLGGRNLLPAVMALVMIASRSQTWGRWVSLPLIALASASSIEILVFALVPWGYCLLLDAVRTRSLRLFATWIALAGVAIAATQIAFVATVYLSTGRMVDYRPYFSLFLQFRPGDGSIWSVPFVPYYALWLPIGLAYFSIMAAAGFRALRGDGSEPIVERLLPVAAFGLGPLAYFMGRPQEGALNVACLSFAVVAIGIAEGMFVNAWRYGRGAVALSRVMACAFAFIAADGFEHFMRVSDPGSGNSTILRRCLSGEGCRLGDVLPNIRLALQTQPLDPRTGVGFGVHDDGHRQRIVEVTSMLRRFAPGAREVGMLADLYPHIFADSDPAIGLTAFMATGQWYAWSVSSPVIDGASPLVADRVLRRVASTPSGTLIITPNRADDWAPLNKAILERLRETCHLRPLEKGQYHTAFLTEDCRG